MPSKNKSILLTKLELEVMRVVWEAGEPLTVRDVVDRLNADRKRPLAYTTVQTMLTILKAKRVVDAQPGPGRAHRFAARVTREQVSTHMIGDLVDRLFDGKVQPLLLHLVGEEKLSRKDLIGLKNLIQDQLSDDAGAAVR